MDYQTFNISLPKDLVKAADKAAKKDYRTRSDLIREALRLYLADKDRESQDKMNETEWRKRWDSAMRGARKAGRRWTKANGIDLKNVTEEELYDLIDKVSGRG